MSDPKFSVGQMVHCFREETEHLNGFDFTGKVVSCALAGDMWEYSVTNAPAIFPGSVFSMLIWESEMEAAT